ncbi:CYTH-like domain-containing protein [Cladochytrium replicatum]|nr:CYTH-like domain-containing protein [Cladochytrium replicatum]
MADNDVESRKRPWVDSPPEERRRSSYDPVRDHHVTLTHSRNSSIENLSSSETASPAKRPATPSTIARIESGGAESGPRSAESDSITPRSGTSTSFGAEDTQQVTSTEDRNQNQQHHQHQHSQHSNSQHPQSNTVKLSPSVWGEKPLDPIVKRLDDFIQRNLRGRPNWDRIEIEAKLGIIVEKRRGYRLYLPVQSESVLDPSFQDVRFESNMTMQQHQHFNKLLNGVVRPGSGVTYKHHHLVDSFYKGQRGEKIRVTTDRNTGEIVKDGVISKQTIAHMNVYMPECNLDYRITLSEELPKPSPEAECTNRREKDRLSYDHQIVRVDLTQVKSSSGYGNQEWMHELEVELAVPKLAHERTKLLQHGPSRSAYYDFLATFLNNVRLLGGKALPPTQGVNLGSNNENQR